MGMIWIIMVMVVKLTVLVVAVVESSLALVVEAERMLVLTVPSAASDTPSLLLQGFKIRNKNHKDKDRTKLVDTQLEAARQLELSDCISAIKNQKILEKTMQEMKQSKAGGANPSLSLVPPPTSLPVPRPTP